MWLEKELYQKGVFYSRSGELVAKVAKFIAGMMRLFTPS